MIRMTWLILALMLTVGCNRPHGIDTGTLASNFKTAEPTLKAEADKAIVAIKAGNFTEAIAKLQQLAKRAKLTAEQQQVIKDTIAQVQKQMEVAANKAAAAAKKSLPPKK